MTATVRLMAKKITPPFKPSVVGVMPLLDATPTADWICTLRRSPFWTRPTSTQSSRASKRRIRMSTLRRCPRPCKISSAALPTTQATTISARASATLALSVEVTFGTPATSLVVRRISLCECLLSYLCSPIASVTWLRHWCGASFVNHYIFLLFRLHCPLCIGS